MTGNKMEHGEYEKIEDSESEMERNHSKSSNPEPEEKEARFSSKSYRTSIFPPTISVFPRRYDSDFFKGKPSVPPAGPDSREIIVKSPVETRILMVGLFISVVIFTGFYWEAFGVINQKLVLVLNGLVLLGTVDYLQKSYVLKGGSVARRVLFRWFSYDLPVSFSVRRDMSGAIVIVDDSDDSVVLTIGRDMVNPAMTAALKDLYQYSSESTFEIS